MQMSASLKTCLISSCRKIKPLIQQLIRRRTKHKALSSNFDFSSSSSFATMEVSSQLRQVFKVMDSNGDGKISSLELSEVLLCLGGGGKEASSIKEAEAMVKQMDSNGDGFIDLDEFMDAVLDHHRGDGGGGKKEEDYLMDAFLIFDTDKNGLISAMELRRVLINLGFDDDDDDDDDQCSLEDCRRMIKGFDKDGDGFVDFKEFRSMLS